MQGGLKEARVRPFKQWISGPKEVTLSHCASPKQALSRNLLLTWSWEPHSEKQEDKIGNMVVISRHLKGSGLVLSAHWIQSRFYPLLPFPFLLLFFRFLSVFPSVLSGLKDFILLQHIVYLCRHSEHMSQPLPSPVLNFIIDVIPELWAVSAFVTFCSHRIRRILLKQCTSRHLM